MRSRGDGAVPERDIMQEFGFADPYLDDEVEG
jgi:hypothetical protein